MKNVKNKKKKYLKSFKIIIIIIKMEKVLPKIQYCENDALPLPEHILETQEIKLPLSMKSDENEKTTITYSVYRNENQLTPVKSLMDIDLSEPYSIYTYRYFLNDWSDLTFLVHCGNYCIGAIICKTELHQNKTFRGYIAMLVVDKEFRKRGIATKLVTIAINKMIEKGVDEVVLETEIKNKSALSFYERLGFIRDKRLHMYYLNQGCAYRLKLFVK
jgi:peptide alpha-N-acetyltransferase